MDRAALWAEVAAELAALEDALAEAPLVPAHDLPVEEDFERPRDPREVVRAAARALARGIVPTSHPRYLGLLAPPAHPLGVVADALASAANPQLAVRGHAPWPVAVEEAVIRAVGARLGYPSTDVDGVFTSGGAESNLTALVAALSERLPAARDGGVRALPGDPVLYVSDEGHASVRRAARIAGLGADAVRVVPSGADHRMKAGLLGEAIAADRARGALPFLVVATAGTTSAGAVDPLEAIAKIAARHGLWLHVDAAWGGLLALAPERAPALAGIAEADSIAFDPHKALRAPMGTGLLLTRRRGALAATFGERAGYMPRGDGEPYAKGIAWSRRFVGLRVYLPLAAEGWAGHADAARAQLARADELRARLAREGWVVVNDTPLPVVCFRDAERADARFLDAVAREVIARGDGWISVPRFANGGRALRACFDNPRTTSDDVARLVAGLAAARERAPAAPRQADGSR